MTFTVKVDLFWRHKNKKRTNIYDEIPRPDHEYVSPRNAFNLDHEMHVQFSR